MFEIFKVLKIRLLRFGLFNFSVTYFISSTSKEHTAYIFREYDYAVYKINLKLVFYFWKLFSTYKHTFFRKLKRKLYRGFELFYIGADLAICMMFDN